MKGVHPKPTAHILIGGKMLAVAQRLHVHPEKRKQGHGKARVFTEAETGAT